MSDSGSHRTSLHSFNISADIPSGPGVLLTLSSSSLFLMRCLVIVTSSTLGPWNMLFGFGDGWLTSSLTNTPLKASFIVWAVCLILCHFSRGSFESGDGSLSRSHGADVCPKVFLVVDRVECYLSFVTIFC